MKFFAALVVSCLSLAAFAAPPPYYIAGDFNGWNAGGALMTETSPGSGIWQATLSMAAGRHEFKVTGGDWSWNYPGPNSWLYAPASGTIGITFDANTYSDGWLGTGQRIGLSYDLGSWTAVGDFNGWNNAANNMVSLGGGIYSYQAVLTPGEHKWKAVVSGSWDAISSDSRNVGAADFVFNVSSGTELCTFWVDAYKGTVKLDMAAVPEPSAFALMACGIVGWLARRRN